jgi:DHA1 family bicyclomycin/chloramphenicol resistance-like MFS transporter
VRSFLTAGRIVLGNREYVGYLVVAGAAVGALFAYVATSAFVLQTMNGLSPILSGQIAALAAGVAMLVAALWLGTALVVAIGCFFVLMTAQGLMIPNGGALASAAVPEYPGTGSAMQGFVQWVAAGTIAPIAGLGHVW